MSIRRTHLVPSMLMLALFAPSACVEEWEALGEDADGDEDAVSFRLSVVENTGSVVGIKFNTGSVANGKPFTLTDPDLPGMVYGHRLRTVTFAGANAGKTWNKDVYLANQAAGRLTFRTTDNLKIDGAAIEGTVLGFDTDDDGDSDVQVKLGREILDNTPDLAGGCIYYYEVQTREVGEQGWRNLCGDDESLAVFADGDWSIAPIDRYSARGDQTNGNDTIALSCLDGAIHKCLIQGKRPTDSAGELRHEVCVQAFTAAYDGSTHTVEGTPIDLHEAAGATPRFTIDPIDLPIGGDLVKEAEWGPDGANCVNRQALRRPQTIPGCPNDSALRNVSTCVLRDAAQNDIPECSADHEYDTGFDFASTVMATYTSRAASRTDYDQVKDVYWGVEGTSSTLFKGVLKQGLQTITSVGAVVQSRVNLNGIVLLTPVYVDGLFYSDRYETLMGFEVDADTPQSRLVWIRPNGHVSRTFPWFPGRVSGADAARGAEWAFTLVREYPDQNAPNSKIVTVGLAAGETREVRNLVKAAGSGHDNVIIHPASDIARRTAGPPGQRVWYLVNGTSLYSFSRTPQTINGNQSVVLDPLLVAHTGDWAGLAFAHPTDNSDALQANDKMLAFDVNGADSLQFMNLSGSYGLSSLASAVVPERDATLGDLATQ